MGDLRSGLVGHLMPRFGRGEVALNSWRAEVLGTSPGGRVRCPSCSRWLYRKGVAAHYRGHGGRKCGEKGCFNLAQVEGRERHPICLDHEEDDPPQSSCSS